MGSIEDTLQASVSSRVPVLVRGKLAKASSGSHWQTIFLRNGEIHQELANKNLHGTGQKKRLG